MYTFRNVTELNVYVHDLFAQDVALSNFELTAEISGFKQYSSGHCYFSLKDKDSVVSCVMFRNYVSTLDFVPQDGVKVVVTGSADCYSPNGKYQIKVFSMKKLGKGDLNEQFKQLYAKLQSEGLFSDDFKKSIPVLPSRIGVLSSPSGAVIHDMINTLRRRNPHFDILLYPVAVQGATCAQEVIEGLNYFNYKNNVDVIIIARGGGSLEDLFGFNDEKLARTIFNSKIPVISAIGHEVDYTISDYVADLRAPTPTAAAELVMGKYEDLKNNVDNLTLSLDIGIRTFIDSRRNQLNGLSNHKALHSPLFYVQGQTEVLKKLVSELNSGMDKALLNKKHELNSIVNRMEDLNPDNVLKRGYSYISDSEGKAIESVNNLKIDDNINIVFGDGKANAVIKKIEVK